MTAIHAFTGLEQEGGHNVPSLRRAHCLHQRIEVPHAPRPSGVSMPRVGHREHVHG